MYIVLYIINLYQLAKIISFIIYAYTIEKAA